MTPKEEMEQAIKDYNNSKKARLTEEQQKQVHAYKEEMKKYQKGSEEYNKLRREVFLLEIYGGSPHLD